MEKTQLLGTEIMFRLQWQALELIPTYLSIFTSLILRYLF